MVEYIETLLNDWSKYGNDIKKIFHNNKLEMDSTKIKKLTNEELVEIYKKFMVDSDIKINKYTIGTSAIFLSKNIETAIKIIKTESINELGDTIINDNVLIIYKGTEKDFYVKLLKRFKDNISLIIKIVDDEIIFKYSVNINLIKKLNDIQEENNIIVRNFIEKSNIVGTFSEDFKQQWIKCIQTE